MWRPNGLGRRLVRNGTGYAYTRATVRCTAKCEGCGRRREAEAMQYYWLRPGIAPAVDTVCLVLKRLFQLHIAEHSQLACCTITCASTSAARIYQQALLMLARPEEYPTGFAWVRDAEEVSDAV